MMKNPSFLSLNSLLSFFIREGIHCYLPAVLVLSIFQKNTFPFKKLFSFPLWTSFILHGVLLIFLSIGLACPAVGTDDDRDDGVKDEVIVRRPLTGGLSWSTLSGVDITDATDTRPSRHGERGIVSRWDETMGPARSQDVADAASIPSYYRAPKFPPPEIEGPLRLEAVRKFISQRNAAFRQYGSLKDFREDSLNRFFLKWQREDAQDVYELERPHTSEELSLILDPSSASSETGSVRKRHSVSSLGVRGSSTFIDMAPPRFGEAVTVTPTSHDLSRVMFTLSEDEAAFQQRLYRSVELGLLGYCEEHRKTWSARYTARELVVKGLAPALISGGVSVFSLYISHLISPALEVSAGKIFVGFFSGGALLGLGWVGCKAAAYRLGFTPSIYRLEPEEFEDELALLSLFISLKHKITKDQQHSIAFNKFLRGATMELLEIIRVKPPSLGYVNKTRELLKSSIFIIKDGLTRMGRPFKCVWYGIKRSWYFIRRQDNPNPPF